MGVVEFLSKMKIVLIVAVLFSVLAASSATSYQKHVGVSTPWFSIGVGPQSYGPPQRYRPYRPSYGGSYYPSTYGGRPYGGGRPYRPYGRFKRDILKTLRGQ